MSEEKKDEFPDSVDEEPYERTHIAEDLRLGLRHTQKPWLLVVGGKRCVGTLVAVRHKMTIGRVAPAELVLDEKGVSRRHAQIDILQGGVIRVSDLGSSNGIRVNGRLVKQHPLRDGERLRLGDAVLTLVHIDDDPAIFAKNLRDSADLLEK